MNKNSIVQYTGTPETAPAWYKRRYTKGKLYRVVAGIGDGNPANRSNGTLGAVITNPDILIIEDDFGEVRETLMSYGVWKVVKEIEAEWVPPVVNSDHVYHPKANKTRERIRF